MRIVPILIVLASCRPSPVTSGPRPDRAVPAGLRLEGATAPSFADVEGVALRWKLTTTGAPCKASALELGTLTITSMTRDGVAITPSLRTAEYEEGLGPVIAAYVAELGAGLALEIATDASGMVSTVSWSPSERHVLARWPLSGPGAYRVSAVYALPPTVPGLPPDACRGASTTAVIEFRVQPRGSQLPGAPGLMVIPILAVVALAIRRRRTTSPFVLAVALLSATASAKIEPIGDITPAVDACIARFKEPARPPAPRGDPSGLYSGMDASGHTVTIQRPPNPKHPLNRTYGSPNDSNCYNGVGTDSIIEWSPTDTTPYSDGVKRDPCASLYHELSHASHCARGDENGALCGSTGIRTKEIAASFAENAYRWHAGLPARTTYRGDDDRVLPLPLDGLAACGPGGTGKGGGGKGGHDECKPGTCATSNGDPHLRTFDGRHYDFQTAGEFTLARSTSDAFELQVRQQPYFDSTTVTITTAVAMQIAGTRFGIYVTPSGIVTSPTTLPASVTTFPADYGTGYRVTWPDGSVVRVSPLSVFGLTLEVAPAVTRRGQLVGLLGNFDGDPQNDLVSRDGRRFDSPSFEELYRTYGESWRVGTSLFDAAAGTSTATFTDRRLPSQRMTAADLPTGADATAICRGAGVTDPQSLDDCALDVAVTGQAAFLDNAVTVQAARDATSPPPLAAPEPIALGDQVRRPLAAGQVARFTLHGARGQHVYVTSNAHDCDLSIQLYQPDGHELGLDYPMCADLGRVELPVEGDYAIRIRGTKDHAGTLALRISAIPPDLAATTAIGGRVLGKLAAPGQRHRYTFPGAKDQAITVTSLVKDCAMELRLFAPDGSEQGLYAMMCGDRGRVVLAATGRYAIEIRGASDHVGPYGFAIAASK
jgi:von Willebrand factor type D domain